jgi:hypothetical protein
MVGIGAAVSRYLHLGAPTLALELMATFETRYSVATQVDRTATGPPVPDSCASGCINLERLLEVSFSNAVSVENRLSM